MALCGTIKHHNKNEKPCVLGFWHFLTSERIAGLSASLSATKKEVRNGFLFSFVATGVDETKGAHIMAHIILLCF